MLNTIIPSKKTINVFESAFMFPSNSFAALLVSDKDRKNLVVSKYENDVLGYIRKKKTASLFEIADMFNIGLDEVALILKKLDSEKKIRLVDS